MYNENLRQFITSRVLSEDIQERYNNKRQLIKEDDKFYAAKIRSLENRRHAEIESLEAFKRKEKKHQDTASIKALAIKKKRKS